MATISAYCTTDANDRASLQLSLRKSSPQRGNNAEKLNSAMNGRRRFKVSLIEVLESKDEQQRRQASGERLVKYLDAASAVYYVAKEE